MTWIQTYDGRPFDLNNPKPEQVSLATIAHSLSMQCRFNGHSRIFYSVGEHSVQVGRLAGLLALEEGLDPRRLEILGLLHDAAEAYVGDVVTPLKTQEHHEHEWMAQWAISKALEVPQPLKEEDEIVGRADRIMLAVERDRVMAPSTREWTDWDPNLWRVGARLGAKVVGFGPMEAKELFLASCRRLGIGHERRVA